jgi:hypothetical protein
MKILNNTQLNDVKGETYFCPLPTATKSRFQLVRLFYFYFFLKYQLKEVLIKVIIRDKKNISVRLKFLV